MCDLRLDWDGSERTGCAPAGVGQYGHVFDDFAPKLTGSCHVYSITQRDSDVPQLPDFRQSREPNYDPLLFGA